MKFDYNGFTVYINQQEDVRNPREDVDGFGKPHDGLISTLVCFHKRYSLGDETEYKTEDYPHWGAMAEGITRKEKDIVVMRPLYLLDHSGITMSTSPFACDPGGWDSGRIGFAFVTKRRIRECYGIRNVSKKHIERATEEMLSEIATYDSFLRGEVYEYIIRKTDGTPIDAIDAEEGFVDSCGDFYSEHSAETEAKAWIDSHLHWVSQMKQKSLAMA